MRKILIDLLHNPRLILIVGVTVFLLINAVYSVIHLIHQWRHPQIAIVEQISSNPVGSTVQVPTVHWAAPKTAAPIYQHENRKMQMPQATMNSTSAYTVVQLHDAAPTFVGGGVGGGNIAMANTQGGSSKRGETVNNGAIPVTGMIYLSTAHNAITAVGANRAEEVVNEKMGIIRKEPGFPDPPSEPTPDPEDPETPVGDVPFALMALFTIAWGVLIRRKRQQVCK